MLRRDATILVDAKSGVSGAGRQPKPNLHYPEANENLTAYRVGSHQHTGEIQQTFDRLAGRRVPFCFVPHLIPMDRGILATCYLPLARPVAEADVKERYDAFYHGAPFVRVLTGEDLPATKDVSHSNYCHVAARVAGDYVVAISVIDNLVKGASGQAVQNMNILFGLDETLGMR
jgi:N-acetyl-gamma-glutamyl-phosphate reductase